MVVVGSVAAERGALRHRPGSVLAVSVLAIVEAVVSLFFAMAWLRTGTDMFEHGVLVLPLLSVVLYFRVFLLVTTAALYLLFAWAALTGRRWAWSTGLAAVVLDGLIVLTLLGVPMVASLRAILPLVVLGYLLSAHGRRALGR